MPQEQELKFTPLHCR